MTTKDGKQVVACAMTNNTEKYGNCASCMYYKITGSFGEGYCTQPEKVKERKEEGI